ncbi:hypothetical protein CLOM_g17204 [Closterium sp. NIES-68]|nr:hypothetical protein CLOM_g17204 [Closterium sp. NIES-68]
MDLRPQKDADLENQVACLTDQLARECRQTALVSVELQATKEKLKRLEDSVEEKDAIIAEKNDVISEKNPVILEKNALIKARNAVILELQVAARAANARTTESWSKGQELKDTVTAPLRPGEETASSEGTASLRVEESKEGSLRRVEAEEGGRGGGGNSEEGRGGRGGKGGRGVRKRKDEKRRTEEQKGRRLTNEGKGRRRRKRRG